MTNPIENMHAPNSSLPFPPSYNMAVRSDICPISAFFNATQFAVKKSDDKYCVPGGFQDTSLSSSASSTGKEAAVPGASQAPATPAPSGALSTQSTTIAPSSASNFSTADSSKSGSVVGSTETISRGDDVGGGEGTSTLGIMFACFLIGVIVVAVPAGMYFRRFRYEAMREFGGSRVGGHSYEMT